MKRVYLLVALVCASATHAAAQTARELREIESTYPRRTFDECILESRGSVEPARSVTIRCRGYMPLVVTDDGQRVIPWDAAPGTTLACARRRVNLGSAQHPFVITQQWFDACRSTPPQTVAQTPAR